MTPNDSNPGKAQLSVDDYISRVAAATDRSRSLTLRRMPLRALIGASLLALSMSRQLAAQAERRDEALERFVRKEPLRRVHECVFGVLALESEPVDPRL